jgi:hypothetical protein
MNPPTTDDDDNGYSGSEPLDAALADRFAFIRDFPIELNFYWKPLENHHDFIEV